MWKITKTGRGHKPMQAHPSPDDSGLSRMISFRRSVTGAAAHIARAFLRPAPRLPRPRSDVRSLTRQRAISVTRAPLHLDVTTRRRMLDAMSGWRFDQRSKTFVPRDSSPERFEELLDAITDLPAGSFVLRVSGLSESEAARVRRYLQAGSVLTTLDHRMCEPVFI